MTHWGIHYTFWPIFKPISLNDSPHLTMISKDPSATSLHAAEFNIHKELYLHTGTFLQRR